MLEIKNVNCSIGNCDIVKGVNLKAHKGQFIALIGPNGCGKTTLLKTIYRELKPKSGVIYIRGEEISGISNKELSGLLASVAQEHNVEFDFTVKEIINMGRYSKLGRFAFLGEEDERLVRNALEKVGLIGMEERNFLSLSGGEKQRVMIALALAQNPEIIVLDEPTNHLDIKYQLEIIHMLRHLDITVVTTLHDMNIVGTYSDYIYAMKNGKIVAEGAVEDVFTEAFFEKVFEIEAYVYKNPKNGKINISYLHCCK